jgi:hypothetical protein
MKKLNDDYSLGNAMQEFLQKNKLQQGINAENIKETWFKVLPNITNYTTHIELKRNTLYVALSSAIVREEMQLRKQEIIDMLNTDFGTRLVYDIKFK